MTGFSGQRLAAAGNQEVGIREPDPPHPVSRKHDHDLVAWHEDLLHLRWLRVAATIQTGPAGKSIRMAPDINLIAACDPDVAGVRPADREALPERLNVLHRRAESVVRRCWVRTNVR
jgi:hypothetical protein